AFYYEYENGKKYDINPFAFNCFLKLWICPVRHVPSDSGEQRFPWRYDGRGRAQHGDSVPVFRSVCGSGNHRLCVVSVCKEKETGGSQRQTFLILGEQSSIKLCFFF